MPTIIMELKKAAKSVNKKVAGLSLATFLSLVAALVYIFPQKNEVPTKQEFEAVEQKVIEQDKTLTQVKALSLVSCINAAKNKYDREACYIVAGSEQK